MVTLASGLAAELSLLTLRTTSSYELCFAQSVGRQMQPAL